MIPFLLADATAPVNKPKVSTKIQATISERNPQILTTVVVKNIFFQGTLLSPGKVIKLNAYYSDSQWQGSLLFYVRENSQQQTLLDALQKIDQRHPLPVDYLKADAIASASKETVTAKLRIALQKRNEIFTKKTTSSINFSDTPLTPGNIVAVTVTYQSWKVVIYIAEALDAHTLKESATQIAGKIRWTLYLKTFCEGKYADHPAVVKIIRKTLIGYQLLTWTEAQYIQPEHFLISSGHQYRLRVIKDGHTAFTQQIPLSIWTYSQIMTLVADDYDFHFLAYFTPGNYLWLKNILMNDPKFSKDEWILGCFMQVLNDNDIDTDWENIPWTDSFPKFFRWDNRLEEHMGDFGPWPVSKSEIINMMINRKDIDHLTRKVRACKDIDILILTLRGFLNYQTAEDNFGMMLNIEWNYDTDSNAMSLKSAYIW